MKPPRLRNRKGLPAEVCGLDLRRWTGLAVASRDLVTRLAFEGLSENEIGRARISIMARSDLLHVKGRIQKRKTNHCSEDSACNPRPVHTVGSKAAVAAGLPDVGLPPDGGIADIPQPRLGAHKET